MATDTNNLMILRIRSLWYLKTVFISTLTFWKSERMRRGQRCGETTESSWGVAQSEQEHFSKMLNFNYSLRHLLVSTPPKTHLLLIKNTLLPFRKQLILCLIMVAVYGSQLKHSHVLLRASDPALCIFQCLNKGFTTCQLLFFPSVSPCWFVCEMHSTLNRKLPCLSVLQADQTGWDISFLNLYRSQTCVPVTSRKPYKQPTNQ